jgi:dihydrofolate synthase/folylpolyglutamate synthase
VQPPNALLAAAAARELAVPEPALREALARVQWPGRFQVLGRDPWLVLDGAHNPAGARALAGSLRDFFGGAPVTFVIGTFRDKDSGAMLEALAPLARRFILTAAATPRAATPESLRSRVPASVPLVQVAGSTAEALALAEVPPRTSVRCVAGSLYLIGEVLRHLAGGRETPCPIEKGAASMGSLS